METTLELKQVHEAFAEFKKVNDQVLAEIKQYGQANGELTAKLDKLNGILDEKEAKINKRLDEVEAKEAARVQLIARLDEIDAKLSRKGAFGVGGTMAEQAKEEALFARKVFVKALRSTIDPRAMRTAGIMDEAELKALVIGNDKTGGYLAPPEYVAEMITSIVEWSNLRALCRVRTTSSASVTQPKRTTTAAATWVAEKTTRAETTNPAYGLEEVKTHEMHALAKVSHADLEDSVFDLEGFLRDEFAEQFGLSEGTAFVSGNAIAKPEGVLTNADIAYTAGGDASLLTADGMIAIYYDIKEPYLVNATWVMSRATLKAVRQLKNAVSGEYIWAAGIKTDARPATILDRPYITAPDMPSIAGNAFPVLFGDFRRGYLIVDRLSLEVMVDPYTSKSTGMVEFSARKRVGGQVILAEAIRKLKIATS